MYIFVAWIFFFLNLLLVKFLVVQTVKCLQCGRPGFCPWVGKISWRMKWQPAPVFLPGKSHGRRSLVGYSPWGHEESDMVERLHFHFLLVKIVAGRERDRGLKGIHMEKMV